MSTTLKAQVRKELGSSNARRERNEGKVLGVVYGHGGDSVPVAVDALELNRILASDSGSNTLITLDIEGSKDTALARQIHRHPTKPHIIHVDFIRVNVNEEVEAEVPLHLEGTAEGVKDGGRLEQIFFNVKVKAKPADIPVSLTHDVSSVELGGHVQLKEISLPNGVEAIDDPEEVIAVVSVPKGASEEEAAEAADAESAAAEGGEAKAEGDSAEAKSE